MEKKNFMSLLTSQENKDLILSCIKKMNHSKEFKDNQIHIAIDSSLQFLLEIGCLDDIHISKLSVKDDVASELYGFNCKIIKHAVKDLMNHVLVNENVLEPPDDDDDPTIHNLRNIKKKETQISIDRHTNYSHGVSDSDSEDYKKNAEGDEMKDVVSSEKTPRQLWMNR